MPRVTPHPASINIAPPEVVHTKPKREYTSRVQHKPKNEEGFSKFEGTRKKHHNNLGVGDVPCS